MRPRTTCSTACCRPWRRTASGSVTPAEAASAEPAAETRPAVRAAYVVVPAHDEQERVGRCLASVQAAAEVARQACPGVRVEVVLVLDRCTDRTAAVAARLGVVGLPVRAGGVGAARAAGVAEVLARLQRPSGGDGPLDPEQVWVLSTDADCVVPLSWVSDHLRLSAHHDLVQGEVHPDPAELSGEALDAWRRRNPAGHGSLHGANLGFRASAYLRAGGFVDVAEHEDVLLVRAIKAAGLRATSGTTVQTSARRRGRVLGGFAGYLRELDAELDAGLGAGPGAQPPGAGSTSPRDQTTSSTSRSA